MSNSLQNRFPEIAKEWDYEKNNPLTPDCISYGSKRKFWWKCPHCQQSYESSVCNRTSKSKQKKTDKCPVCQGKVVIPGVNSLKARHPLLVARDWDYELNIYDPDTIAPQSNKKVWWKCNKGHKSYEARVQNKVNNNGGNCPYCSHQRLAEENSLGMISPELAEEWSDKNGKLTPFDVSYASNKTVWWKCSQCGYEWSAKIDNRYNKKGCPNCSKGTHTSFPEQLIFFYVKQLFPDAINGYKLNGNTEIDIYIPTANLGIEYDGEYYHGTAKLKRDLAKNKTLQEEGIQLVRFREVGCVPLNDNKCKIITVEHSELYTDLAKKLQIFLSDISINHSIKIDVAKDWKQVWKIRNTIPFENSFAYYYNKQKENGTPLKAIWDDNANYPLTPFELTPKSSKKAFWMCPTKPSHKWQTTVGSISNGTGCPYCAGRHLTTEEWVKKAINKHGNKYDYSKSIYLNSKTPITIICPVHGEFKQDPSDHLAGKGCRFCSNTGGFTPLNSLRTIYPELAKEWDIEKNSTEYNVSPDDVHIHDTRQFWWHCNNGKPHSYKSTINYRVKRNSGCAVCHGKQISEDTSLASLRPDLIEEWAKENEIRPEHVSIGSEEIVFWKCKNPIHPIYKTTIINRCNTKYGCPYCSGNKKHPLEFKKEIQELYPNIHLINAYKKASIKIECKCKLCGNQWSAFPGNLKKTGCTKCKNMK